MKQKTPKAVAKKFTVTKKAKVLEEIHRNEEGESPTPPHEAKPRQFQRNRRIPPQEALRQSACRQRPRECIESTAETVTSKPE